MITDDERTSIYIDSLSKINTPFLEDLEVKCIEGNVPIIRKSMQNLLKFLISAYRPKSILEVGTAVGFSAILMAQETPEDARITTIEKYEVRIPIAKENFKKSGLEDKIEFIEGDATDVLKQLIKEGRTFDMVFMDAAKGQYLNFYEDVLSLLRKGGLLVSDNVLQDGDIVQSRFAVKRRNRTIHARMREYLRTISNDDRLTTSILPVGDGVSLSVKEV